jgi:hypothetical protein
MHLPMIRPEICAPCGGRCCKTLPGAASPEDFGAPDKSAMLARLTAAFAAGRWAVDWWEGEPSGDVRLRHDVYFPRPIAKDHDAGLLVPYYPEDMGSTWSPRMFECTFLGPTGCELAHEDRPLECRALEPRADRNCVEHAGRRQERALEWHAYQHVLKAAIKAHDGA